MPTIPVSTLNINNAMVFKFVDKHSIACSMLDYPIKQVIAEKDREQLERKHDRSAIDVAENEGMITQDLSNASRRRIL